MELRNLQYFLKVAEYESMTKAAEELHVAQPALSRAVKLLEEEIGAPLFDRNGKNLKLNYRGRVAQGRIKMAFALINGLYSESSAAESELYLRIRTLNSPIMQLISDFSAVAKNVHVNITNTGEKGIQILSGVTGEALTGCAILNEELFLAVPLDEQNYQPDILSLDDFKASPFIMPPKNDSLRDNIEELCRRAGFVPEVVYETDNPMLVEQLIAGGMGIAFWPDLSWGISHNDSVLRIHIQKPFCWRNIYLAWDPGSSLTPAEERFIDFASDYFLRPYPH